MISEIRVIIILYTFTFKEGKIAMKRWYDDHRIGIHLDKFKTMQKKDRDPIINHILQLIQNDGRHLIDKNVWKFPLDETGRRWYDNDPSLWMVFHGLECAEKELLDNVADYLDNVNIPAQVRQ